MTAAKTSKTSSKGKTSSKTNKGENTAPEVKQEQTFTMRLVVALTARSAEQPSGDTDTALSVARTSAVSIDRIMSEPAFAEIANGLLIGARIADAKQNKGEFIAVKVLVKIVHLLAGLGGQGLQAIDGYSVCIVRNMLAAGGLTNKGALVSLSKSIEFDALDTVQMVKHQYNCAPSTATTQASSSRMMLHYLKICEVSKGKRNDTIKLSDNARAVRFAAMFATA